MQCRPLSVGPILLAHRDARSREAMGDTLTTAGFQVLEVSSTDDALGYLESRRDVRLLVVEPEMPGCLSGLALARFVAQRWPMMPVIFAGWPAQPVSCLPGTVTFVPNPCPATVLIEQVWRRIAPNFHDS